VFSLAGKKALVIGIANEESIAYGCAKAFRAQGADLAITFQNAKTEAFVRPIAEKLGTDILLPLDVREQGQFGRLSTPFGAFGAASTSACIPSPFARNRICMSET
jgi:enoyl-[acyl-carrier protein] reductase I